MKVSVEFFSKSFSELGNGWSSARIESELENDFIHTAVVPLSKSLLEAPFILIFFGTFPWGILFRLIDFILPDSQVIYFSSDVINITVRYMYPSIRKGIQRALSLYLKGDNKNMGISWCTRSEFGYKQHINQNSTVAKASHMTLNNSLGIPWACKTTKSIQIIVPYQ